MTLKSLIALIVIPLFYLIVGFINSDLFTALMSLQQ